MSLPECTQVLFFSFGVEQADSATATFYCHSIFVKLRSSASDLLSFLNKWQKALKQQLSVSHLSFVYFFLIFGEKKNHYSKCIQDVMREPP